MKRHRLFVLLAAVLLAPGLASSQTVEYAHLDALGNIRAVTDHNGAVIERHDYLPFGEEYNPQPGNQPLRFTGKERDTETGFDYFGARYYQAKWGRFTTIDPVLDQRAALVDPQQWNRYAYGRNNPSRYVDPDGRAVRILSPAIEARLRPPTPPAAEAGLLEKGLYTIGLLSWALNPGGLVPDPAMVLVPAAAGARAGVIGGGLLPAFAKTTVDDAVASSGRAIGETTEGARALAKKLGHAESGGFQSAFQGIKPTQENAETLIREILANPNRTVVGGKTIDAYNAAGQGVRLEAGTNMFVGFLEAARATR